jgi:hypothetical protein
MAPLGVKPRSAKAHLRHRAVDVFNFGGVDNASRPRSVLGPALPSVPVSLTPVDALSQDGLLSQSDCCTRGKLACSSRIARAQHRGVGGLIIARSPFFLRPKN